MDFLILFWRNISYKKKKSNMYLHGQGGVICPPTKRTRFCDQDNTSPTIFCVQVMWQKYFTFIEYKQPNL